MSAQPQVAFNPLTWLFRPDGTLDPAAAPPLPEIYRRVRDAGFDAVHVEIPDHMTVADYRRLLADSGLAPAPGYFQAPFADVAGGRSDIVERARRTAAGHAELGLHRIFIAEQFGIAQPRMAEPAIGAAAEPDRLARIIDGLRTAAQAMVGEGVQPCLHQHVGTWIETAEETDAVLAAIDPEVLLFGPDTGHLAWAGADPAAFIARHLERVGAVHLKDVHAAKVERSRTAHRTYRESTSDHLWTEPGNGDLDLLAVLDVLREFDGWYVVEVDIADQPTPEETAAVSAHWVREHLTAPQGAPR